MEGLEGVRREETVGLNKHLLFEVLRRVDPITLATASCVSCDFRSVSEDESLWERICNNRWPSTKNSQVKSILLTGGGYRKMYAQCYPLIVNQETPAHRDEEDDGLDTKDGDDLSPSDLISVVDVIHKDQPVLSMILEGVPGADGCPTWFSNTPFRVDLLAPSGKGNEGRQSGVLIETDFPSTTSVETERKNGNVWTELWDNMRVSWILINKKTKRMTNLSSWRPVGGMRHYPSDDDFRLQFGSVFHSLVNKRARGTAVRCDIILKCSLDFGKVELQDTLMKSATLRCKLTELGLQLEKSGGARANGEEGVAILHEALRCPKSRNHRDVFDSYNQHMKIQGDLNKKETWDDDCLNTLVTVGVISLCVFWFTFWFVV